MTPQQPPERIPSCTTGKKATLEVIAGGLGTKSEGKTTAEQYNASEKGTWSFKKKDYVFEKIAWDKDRFAGIKDRYDLSTGLGRYLLNRKNHKLNAELGLGHIFEDRIGDKNSDFSSARSYGKYIYTLSDETNFTQEVEYIHNFENKEGYRLKTISGLKHILSDHLSLKISYKLDRVGVPPMGFGKTDTTTSMALIFSY